MTTDNTLPPATGWAVTTQRQTVELGPGNQPVSGWKIGFTTRTGVSGEVFVPQAHYNPANVAAAVAAQAAVIDAVQGLSG